MSTLKRNARIAGVLYVLLGLAGPVRLIYVPNAILVRGNAQATMASIASHEAMFRFAIVADMLAALLGLFLALALFRLFKEVDRALAGMMLALGGFMVTPIYFFNLINDAGALVVALGPMYLDGFTPHQREGLVSLFLRLHSYGVVVNEMFWGLWLLPLAALIFKTRLMPRFMAIWLSLNGAGYVLLSVLGILSPRLEAAVSGPAFPLLVAEVVTMFWLAVGRLQVSHMVPLRIEHQAESKRETDTVASETVMPHVAGVHQP
jgi:hypothetical protein